MTRRAVILDACTLIPIRLATTLLWLAEEGLFEPLWSKQILEEVERNLPRAGGITPERAAHRLRLMQEAFGPEAMVTGHESRIADMTCDTKDRHVLAAAAHAEAAVIVTFNLRDFPEESTAPHGTTAQHPDAFLSQLLAAHPMAVIENLRRVTASLKKPTMDFTTYLASLTATAPTFANLVAVAVDTSVEDAGNVAALEVADENEALAAFGVAGDLTNPAQVGLLWYVSLENELDVARALTYRQIDFGDYGWVREALAERSLASKVVRAVDAPDQIAFMRFIPQVSRPSHVIESFVTSAMFLTVVRIEDGTWRVWGLGAGMPAASSILHGN